MPKKTPLDPSIVGAPFSVAEGLAAGTGRRRLQGTDLARPFHGVRTVGPHGRLESYAPRLREGDRFSHTSAAELWGAPLPDRWRATLHVTGTAGLTRPRIRGVVGHETASGSISVRRELPVSSPATMFVELASLLAERELVAVGDYLVLDPRQLDPHDIRPYSTMEALLAEVNHSPTRGVVVARRALARVRQGVESPMETELRLILEDAGLPRPECGYPLRDNAGKHIGWFDLAWPDFRVIAEYDGDQHRTDARQYDLDITRFDRAAEAGWNVVRVRSRGMGAGATGTVERVRRALARGGWRPNRRKGP